MFYHPLFGFPRMCSGGVQGTAATCCPVTWFGSGKHLMITLHWSNTWSRHKYWKTKGKPSHEFLKINYKKNVWYITWNGQLVSTTLKYFFGTTNTHKSKLFKMSVFLSKPGNNPVAKEHFKAVWGK